MKTLTEITDYIWVNDPACQRWNKARFEKWVHWHFSEGFICIVLNVDDSIAGLAMVRPVLSPMDALDPMLMDQEGSCLYLAEVVCTAKGALKALGFAILKRFGMRQTVCYHRPPYYVLESHKASSFRRNLLRGGLSYRTAR